MVLSEKAKRTLSNSHETIIVAGWVSGNPKQGANKKYIDEMGAIELADFRSETTGSGIARIENLKIPRDRIEQTDGQDYELLIVVFSGRKSSPDNLLDCAFYQGSFKAVQGHMIRLECKMIGEENR